MLRKAFSFPRIVSASKSISNYKLINHQTIQQSVKRKRTEKEEEEKKSKHFFAVLPRVNTRVRKKQVYTTEMTKCLTSKFLSYISCNNISISFRRQKQYTRFVFFYLTHRIATNMRRERARVTNNFFCLRRI